MFLAKRLLTIGGSGGVVVGIAVLLLREPLSGWYGLPLGLLNGLGAANLVYGGYSLSLAARRVRPMPLLKLLVAADLAWAVICAVLLAGWAREATWLGRAHLLLEVAWVGGLGWLEWRWRERLRHR